MHQNVDAPQLQILNEKNKDKALKRQDACSRKVSKKPDWCADEGL